MKIPRLSLKQITWLKVLIHLAAFLPLLWIILSINQGWFSADPAKDIQHFTGRMALKLLLASLLVTRVRRLLGLWCFAWATIHLLSYSFLELGIHNLGLLGSELISRPYLTLGIISWIILLFLAATSTLWSQRKLGKKWQILHNGIYLVLILAPIHYLWSVKTFSPQPFIYALFAAILLLLRYKKFRQWLR
jgi:sulfoxide reductase heme-binding subunit YedZ